MIYGPGRLSLANYQKLASESEKEDLMGRMLLVLLLFGKEL
jgi:hypothetical protein